METNDYFTLLLVNMAAGMLLLAIFFIKGLQSPNHGTYVAPFLIIGAIALVGGFFLLFRWPFEGFPPPPQSKGAYNSMFGETSVMFGALMAGAALALARRYDLLG